MRTLVWTSTAILMALAPHAAAQPPSSKKSSAGDPACKGAERCRPGARFALDITSGRLRSVGEKEEFDKGRPSPSMSADGTQIAFVSNHDLLGDQSNADGNLELFILDITQGELEQITASEGGTGAVSPQMNAAGTRIVFASDRDLVGDGSNADEDVQLFLFDTLTESFAQLTHVDGGVASYASGLELSLDDAGIRLAFASDRDLLGNGKNEDENFEIFLLDTTTRSLRQLTDTSGGQGCFAPRIDGDGQHVSWRSDRALLVKNHSGTKPPRRGGK